MDRDKFWTSADNDEVLAEYLAEHSFSWSFDPETTEFVASFGDADRLPRLPETSSCVFCGTPIRNRGDVGWRHEVGFGARGGCSMACPSPND